MTPKEKQILSVISAVAILAGGYVWATKYRKAPEPNPQPVTNDETVNWKIYKDTEYGFELKYPTEAGWLQNPKLVYELGGSKILSLYEARDTMGKRYNSVSVSVDSNQSVDQIAKSIKVENSLEPFSIGNLKGTKVTIGGAVPTDNTSELGKSVYQLHTNNYLYIFSGKDNSNTFTFRITSVHPDLDAKIIDTAIKVLLSFKFTK